MQYSTLVTLALATLSAAAPTQLEARAGVLGTQSYDDLSVSGGVAGDALNEVLAKLPIDTSDFANVDPADIAFLGDVNDIANDAETDAFNVAIEAATGDEKVALQVNTPSLSSSSHLIPTPSKSFSNLHFQARKKLRRLTNKPERQDKE